MPATRPRSFALRLDETEDQAVRAYAELTGQSINDVIRQAVRDQLSDQRRRDELQAKADAIVERYQVAFDKLADL